MKTQTTKTSVIICEFNPLHSGHKRLLDFAHTVSDKVICVMSGNFVQRGMPAVCNKFKRATHAIKAGADLVVELPTVFATASAEDFALGGVKMAESLGADFLVFGSECGDIEQLKRCASLLDDEKVNAQIRQELATGSSYPKAVAAATQSNLLNSPNNTLAVEYLRAIAKIGSHLTPITIKREDNFNGEPKQFASSSALRQNAELRGEYSFDFVRDDIDDTIEQKYCEFATRFLSTLEKSQLECIAEVTEGLHNRIFAADKMHGFEKMMESIKTKRYTRTKLQRIVLNCVLGITKQEVEQAKAGDVKAFVLAIKKSEVQLLANASLCTDLPDSRADRLYRTFDGEQRQTKLLKI